MEKSSCGVGFVASLTGQRDHDIVEYALHALRCVEHRGACGADPLTSDGAGIMTDIPFEMLGYTPQTIAVANLFLPADEIRARQGLDLLEDTFSFLNVETIGLREVPTDISVLGPQALACLPRMVQVIVKRPDHCNSLYSFNQLLYLAKQHFQTRYRRKFATWDVFFVSISAETIVYKALVPADRLHRFYPDLQEPQFKSRFALFHRRFSTNTQTSWDKAQPFRVIAHNGEINTIAGNRSWAYSREKSLGLQANELLTHTGISDSGSFNEMAEALLYRSSLPYIHDILAIMMPPAGHDNSYYTFWARAMEPWDGPAIILYSDGRVVGARLDRNGFRPARWAQTENHFFLCSEAGAFDLRERDILAKGALHAGSGVKVTLPTGELNFADPSEAHENRAFQFNPRLVELPPVANEPVATALGKKSLFGYTEEDIHKILLPMVTTGKEGIGSMGDTARPAIFSTEPRPFFDFFYQDFAQVTNPPVDYLRETLVTDIRVFLGSKPNVFIPAELIPPRPAIALSGPVLTLRQMASLRTLRGATSVEYGIGLVELDCTFDRNQGAEGFHESLSRLVNQGLTAVERGMSIVILSDRNASFERPPMPSLLVLRALVNALNESGMKLKASLVVETGEARSAHHVAVLVGFGATAVCPYLALEIARWEPLAKAEDLSPDAKENNVCQALASGLLKIMAKMGISVLRSYQNAKLFTVFGLGDRLVRDYFPGLESWVGGYEIEDILHRQLQHTEKLCAVYTNGKLVHTYQFREHTQGLLGEKHAMTTGRARAIHNLVRANGNQAAARQAFDEYLHQGATSDPTSLRHLFRVRPLGKPVTLEAVMSRAEILKTFGSGGMSFGAISAEAQRDLILAMQRIGGRSNSGEGGENPYFATDGIAASVKQVASARFGVTALYLATADEFQIKIAQGAKPGEGGQLPATKVTAAIAQARHSPQHIDLISPPPMHDIYSIEDLKELIYELKQFKPTAKISVKLVAGINLGTIAVGVVKAGADIIHVSGGDGGTGAAGLGSMKHAGLPWELGLLEVHRALVANDLRDVVTLRVDGGLQTGRDLILAAVLGAEEFDFGKLPLVAEGCIMARICETNRCPAGIATHDPKFKAKYQGKPEHVVRFFEFLADDVRQHLASLGVSSLRKLVGRTENLEIEPRLAGFVQERNLRLDAFLSPTNLPANQLKPDLPALTVSHFNNFLAESALEALKRNHSPEFSCTIHNTDRAVLATLAGKLAELEGSGVRVQGPGFRSQGSGARVQNSATQFPAVLHQPESSFPFTSNPEPRTLNPDPIKVRFQGSAGQGFGVFLVDGIDVQLWGEANDSVCKGMSGGKVVIRPAREARFQGESNTIIGNCALYGATGGLLLVNGLAGDRFAVRNSGATAVVEGVGLHACEYMTNGCVVILGDISANLGAGMTGGTVYLFDPNHPAHINAAFLRQETVTESDRSHLRLLLERHCLEAGSNRAALILNYWDETSTKFHKYTPRSG
ncbi:MAG: glutamate synthase large subunit [Blastocatellia bacterium]|nr:glutamate synthase large subunit [Blastocatellia bacterium]